jgi:hypothetical protein
VVELSHARRTLARHGLTSSSINQGPQPSGSE